MALLIMTVLFTESGFLKMASSRITVMVDTSIGLLEVGLIEMAVKLNLENLDLIRQQIPLNISTLDSIY